MCVHVVVLSRLMVEEQVGKIFLGVMFSGIAQTEFQALSVSSRGIAAQLCPTGTIGRMGILQ